MRMKMNQKDTRSRALKNQKNTGSSPTEDDDDFRDVTDPYPGVPEDFVYPQKDYTEAYRRQNLELSQIALEYYNKRHRTNYELVEPMDCSVFGPPMWMHLNFTAKLKSARDGDVNSSAKLFFVEFYHEPGRWVVNACRILKGKSSHCDFCQLDESLDESLGTIKHPTHGFHMKHLSEPYALRSRARGSTVG
ncbi:uncharacterized protein LOC110734255 [Chenopodium quinoa]|uniref:uncharacterized protein LOC110734255 n=1 Tax=Chenopodium quinoa TaxID=63459 RepID=UPI000B7774E9|nr:uncharacterized protein LOC110734255 [Chenopodium quinoa]